MNQPLELSRYLMSRDRIGRASQLGRVMDLDRNFSWGKVEINWIPPILVP